MKSKPLVLEGILTKGDELRQMGFVPIEKPYEKWSTYGVLIMGYKRPRSETLPELSLFIVRGVEWPGRHFSIKSNPENELYAFSTTKPVEPQEVIPMLNQYMQHINSG